MIVYIIIQLHISLEKGISPSILRTSSRKKGMIRYPVTGTYCLGSSQILHEDGWMAVEYWTPQVEQIWRSNTDSVILVPCL